MTIPVDIFLTHPDATVPEYKTNGAVGFDLSVIEEKTIQPGETVFLQTGLVICVPDGHVLIIASRSSNVKKGIMLANSIGVIDQDYCGPDDAIHLAIRNFGTEPYTVEKGERIAQGLLLPVTIATFNEIQSLSAPSRGGYGSTG